MSEVLRRPFGRPEMLLSADVGVVTAARIFSDVDAVEWGQPHVVARREKNRRRVVGQRPVMRVLKPRHGARQQLLPKLASPQGRSQHQYAPGFVYRPSVG